MQGRTLLKLAFLLMAVSLAGAGCLGGPSAHYQGPTDVPPDLPNTTGKGKFPVQVQVVLETSGGTPMAGAPVVIYRIEQPASAPSVRQLIGTNSTLAARTDAQGYITANLDKGATYTFVTGSPNWTTEARHLVKITQDLRDRPVVLTLFQTTKRVELAGTVTTTPRGPPLLNFGGSLSAPPVWFPKEVKFHEDPQVNRQYVFRLLTTTAALRWSVGPGEYAELGLRIGFLPADDPNPRIYWEVNRASPLPPLGTFEETLTLEAPALAHGDAIKNARLAVGPYATQTILAPAGMAWTAEVQSTFGTDPVTAGPRPYMPIYTLPAPGAPVILLGILLGAVWAIRQR